MINGELLRDLATFSQWQLLSGDVDPVYPMLRALNDELPSDEHRLWHTLLYVAFYNLTSAHQFFPRFVEALYDAGARPPEDALYRLPTGIERRGLRGGTNMKVHIYDLITCWKQNGKSVQTWLSRGFTDNPIHNWNTLQRTLQLVKFNGRWAGYKTAEILMTVHKWPLEAPDMGMQFSSGPRWGLDMIYGELPGNDAATIAELDMRASALHAAFQGHGILLGIEQLETMLCDFHSLAKGRYYVGHDIDQVQEQLLEGERKAGRRFPKLWEARRALPSWTLGELREWTGVRRDLKPLYRDQGIIEFWKHGFVGGPNRDGAWIPNPLGD